MPHNPNTVVMHSPNAFQMHGTDLDNMTRLLTLQNTVSSTPGHAGHIQQFRTVNHVVVFSASNADTCRVDLETDAALVFPQRCGDFWFHAWRGYLACSVRHTIWVLTGSHVGIGG